MNASLEEVRRLVQREAGIELRHSQHRALQAAVGRVVPGSDPGSFLRLASDPARGPDLVARLIDEITVQETSFLRDRAQLEAIDWKRLLDLAHSTGAGTVRVWSAACATGEEAYSLALLGSEAYGSDSPPVRILATDVSRAALAHSRTASYGPRSVRSLEKTLRERYFHPEDERLVVGEQLRRLVTFSQHNLVSDPIPPGGELPYHLILCRNILIYFDTETAERVVRALEGALTEGGLLVLGAADALCVSGLRRVPALAPKADDHSHAPLRTLRRPLRRLLEHSPEARLSRAVQAADRGEFEQAISEAAEVIAQDPLNAEAYFLTGLVQLETGDAHAAVKSLRGALYMFPGFGPAAFKLGRAYEALGEPISARRAYEQALRTLEPGDDRHASMLEQVEPGEIAAACQARILALSSEGGGR